MAISSIPTFSLKTHTLFFRSPNPWLQSSVSNQTQIHNSIKWSRNKKNRSGSVRSTALMLQSAFLIASKLRIIPEPLDLVIRELGGAGGGGNGGGLGFRKDFGWGGFDGGGRRKKRKLGFLWVLVVGFGLGLWLILGKEIDSDVFRVVLGLSLLGVSVNGWKLGFKDWFLGFCCCAFLVGLGMNRENLQRWVKGFSSMDILRRRRNRRRWIWQWRSVGKMIPFLSRKRRSNVTGGPIDPKKILVFKDAPSGVLAAKNAGMWAIMVPDPRLDSSHHETADLVLTSLLDFNPAVWGLPPFETAAAGS